MEEKKSIPKDKPVCQNCKYHINNPGVCRKYNKYMSRKNTCNSWRIK